jgi:hypothetical protein
MTNSIKPLPIQASIANLVSSISPDSAERRPRVQARELALNKNAEAQVD